MENNSNKEKTKEDYARVQLSEIISLLPKEIRDFIEVGFKYKRIPKEYVLVSVLFAFSNASGLAFNVRHSNYINYANLYFVIVGSRGDVKSEGIDLATNYMNKIDGEDYNNFKKNNSLGQNKSRKQFFIQNSSIQSAMLTHYNNPYSLGLLIDEFKYIIDQMGDKNNQGSEWRTFFLQGNTNKHIDVSRKTTESFRLDMSCPTLLGSLQKEFISNLLANGNLESGLVDRLCFVNKLTENRKLSREEIPSSVIDNYNAMIGNLIGTRRELEDAKAHKTIGFSDEASEKLYEYLQELIDHNTNSILLKAYLSKSQINIHKITLLIHLIKKSRTSDFTSKIELSTVRLAILITDFFITNFKIIIDNEKNVISEDRFREELVNRAELNKVERKYVAQILGVQKSQCSKIYTKYKK